MSDSETPNNEIRTDQAEDSTSIGNGDNASSPEASTTTGPQPGPRVFGPYAFWIVVMPFIFYMAGTMGAGHIESLRIKKIEGTLHVHDDGHRPELTEEERQKLYDSIDPEERTIFGLYLAKDTYPYTYSVVIMATAVVMLLVSWGYFKVPVKFTMWGVLAGVVGVVVWIGLYYLDKATFDLASYSSGRRAFNPFEELKDDPTWMWQFMAIRFFGLVIIVPILEEFFVRGFLIRYVDDPDWDEMPIADAKPWGWASPTIYGVIAHMTEPLSALAWFTMMTFLFKKTRSIWDCVLAHAITNLLLGLYVIKFGAWELW